MLVTNFFFLKLIEFFFCGNNIKEFHNNKYSAVSDGNDDSFSFNGSFNFTMNACMN